MHNFQNFPRNMPLTYNEHAKSPISPKKHAKRSTFSQNMHKKSHFLSESTQKRSTFSKKKHTKRSTFSQNTSKKSHFLPESTRKGPLLPENHPPKSRPGYGPESNGPNVWNILSLGVHCCKLSLGGSAGASWCFYLLLQLLLQLVTVLPPRGMT